MADKKESAGSKLIKNIAKQQNAMEGHFGQIARQQRELAKAAAAAAKAEKAQEKRDEAATAAAAEQHKNLVMKVSGLNMTQLAQQKTDETALSERKAQLDALKKTMKDMGLSIEGNKKIAKEEGKIAKAEIKLQTQNKSTLSKLVGFLTPGGPGDKEKLNEANRKHKGLMGMFGDMKKGIVGMGGKLGGLAKGLGGMAAGGAKGLLGMLKKGALFLAIPALIAFMQSPMFEDLKKWIVDEMIPALGRMVDAIKPVAIAIVNWIKDSFLPITISMLVQGFKDLSTFFSDVFARFSGWSDMTLREKIGAVLGIFTNITELVGKLVGNMIEAVANLFGADGATIRKKYWDPIAKFFTDIVDAVMLIFTDPVAGIKKLFATLWDATKGIGGFIFESLIKPAWGWIKGLFTFGEKDKSKDADSTKGVVGFLTDLVVGIWEWFKGLFDFSSVGAGFASIVNLITLPHQIIFGLVMGVWKWFKGLFGFSTEDTDAADKQTKPGGLGGILLDMVSGVWKWIKGLFGFTEQDTSGVETGETKGIFRRILEAILPAGLLDFISSPITWLLAKVGITKNAETGELTDSSGKVLTPAEAQAQATGIFTKVLKAILPDGLVDFIMGPWSWIKTKLGFGDTSTEKMDMVDPVTGEPIKVGETGGIFSKILKSILPDGLVDFLMSPIDWILNKIGLGKDAKIEDVSKLIPTGIEMPDFSKVIGNLLAPIFPDEWVTGSTIIGKAVKALMPDSLLNILKDIKGLEKGGFLPGSQMAVVGEAGPELFMSKGPGTVIPNEGIQNIAKGLDFMKNAALMGATKPTAATNQAPILVNNITNAPVNNSMQSNTKINTAIGSSDPFTHVAVAY